MEQYTIYQITCKNESIKETYIGSTVNIKIRISKHKYRCNTPDVEGYNFKVYQFIRANGGWINFKFIILETTECKDEYEAYVIEQSYINSLKSELNSISPYTGLTKQEYKKQYKILNKEKIKQYYQQNRNKLNEISKQYRQQNRNKLNEKYCCILCKGPYTYQNIIQHEKSNKHKKHLNFVNK